MFSHHRGIPGVFMAPLTPEYFSAFLVWWPISFAHLIQGIATKNTLPMNCWTVRTGIHPKKFDNFNGIISPPTFDLWGNQPGFHTWQWKSYPPNRLGWTNWQSLIATVFRSLKGPPDRGWEGASREAVERCILQPFKTPRDFIVLCIFPCNIYNLNQFDTLDFLAVTRAFMAGGQKCSESLKHTWTWPALMILDRWAAQSICCMAHVQQQLKEHVTQIPCMTSDIP